MSSALWCRCLPVDGFMMFPFMIFHDILLDAGSFLEPRLGSGFCEAVKTIFQSLVLAGTGHKLDPMSTVLVVMLMSGLLLLVVVVFNRLVAWRHSLPRFHPI